MDRAEVALLRADLRRIQARVDELEAGTEEPMNRRNMLRGLGAAAAGAAVGGLAFARPAAATDGATFIIGDAAQTSQSPTAIIAATSWSASPLVGAFHVGNDAAFSNANAALSCISAHADDTKIGSFTTAIAGKSTSVGAKLDAPVPLELTDTTASGAPNQAVGSQGQFKVDGGDLWFCVASSGTSRWRKLTGNFSAGAFHAVTPFRAYDSRAANPIGNVGPISVGQSRLVSVKDARDSAGVVIQLSAVPLDAKSVAANVTVTGTVGNFGYLTINPGGDLVERASTINWSAAGQTIANGVTLTLNATRELTVLCGGLAGNSTQFIVDITGYFL